MAEAAERVPASPKPRAPAPELSAQRHEALERRAAQPAAGYAALLSRRPAGVQPVQRFKRIDKEGYKASQGMSFESQSLGTGDYTTGYKKHVSATPDLKISKDDSLAIQETTNQPKSFLASDTVITQANSSLDDAESPIRLTKIGGVVLAGDLLHNTSWKEKDEARTQASIGRHVCNETASKISGGIGQVGAQMVLQPATSRGDSSTEKVTGLTLSSASFPLASAMLDEGGTPTSVKQDQEGDYGEKRNAIIAAFKSRVDQGKVTADAVRFYLPEVATTPTLVEYYKQMIDEMRPARDPLLPALPAVTEEELQSKTAERYGKLGADVQEKRSKALGINSYALPDVGEALASFTLGQQDFTGKHPKYLAEIKRIVDGTGATVEQAKAQLTKIDVLGGWTWHFASVVAKSEDGQDYVTLENYNRDPDYEQELKRIHANLARDFDDFKEMAELTDGLFAKENTTESIKMLNRVNYGFQYAGHKLAHELESASDSLNELAKLDKGTAWYFAMYGPAKETDGDKTEDQSFHGAMTRSGDFANPVTLRFRGDKLQEKMGNSPAGDKKLTSAQQFLHAVGEAIKARQPVMTIAAIMKQAEAAIQQARDLYKNGLKANKEDNEGTVALIQAYYDETKDQFEHYIRSL